MAGPVFPGIEVSAEEMYEEDFRVDDRDTVKRWVVYFEEQASVSREITAGMDLAGHRPSGSSSGSRQRLGRSASITHLRGTSEPMTQVHTPDSDAPG